MNEWQRLAAAMAAVVLLLLVYLAIRRPWGKRGRRFTEETRRAISFACVEAARLGSPEIAPIHLLLGLLHVESPAVTCFLPPETWTSIREEVREHLNPGPEISGSQDLPYSATARSVLVAAAREASGLSATQIAPEHLLLGLLHSETSLAALILRERGLRLEGLRARLGGWQE
jgi:ATP-dependent Clp protease ATP-binding subunit ClpC